MEIKAKVDELGTITKRYGDIVKEFEGKTVPPEKRAELQKLHAAGIALKAEIETARADETAGKDMAELDAWTRRPAAGVPLPTGPANEQEGTKALAKKGWELKGGTWYAATSKGLYPMYPHDVLFGGPLDQGTQSEHDYRRTARLALSSPTYGKAVDLYFRAAGRTAPELIMSTLPAWAQKDLSEGSDPGGGFLVPPDYQAELLVRKAARAITRRAGARVQQTSRDQLRYPMVQAATTTAGSTGATGFPTGDSIYESGFIGSWSSETPAFSATDPQFGLFAVPIKKVRVATKLANDFVSDSAVDVVAFLSRNGATNMALVEDQGFLAGDGSPLKPKGIVNNGATTVNLSGSTVNTISNTSSTVGTAPLIKSLWGKLPPQYDEDAVFLMSKGSEAATRKLVDAQNRPLWPTFMAGGMAAPGATSMGDAGATSVYSPRQLEGRPVFNSQFLCDGSVANAGNVAIIYGDFENYLIAERAQITTVVLRERFADTDQIGIILWERVGGDTWNIDGFRFGIL